MSPLPLRRKVKLPETPPARESLVWDEDDETTIMVAPWLTADDEGEDFESEETDVWTSAARL
jgi:hypothetical protein